VACIVRSLRLLDGWLTKRRVRYLYQRDPSAEKTQRRLRFLQGTPASTGTGEPQKQLLTPQERLAQVPLMSNELMFVA
jgi:hypothetical protein